MSVLTPINTANVSNVLLLRQVKLFFESKVNKEGERIIDAHRQEANAIERVAQPWRTLKEDLTEPLRQLDRAVGRIELLDSSLENLIKQLDTADGDEEVAENSLGYRVAFDGLLSSLRSNAESTLDKPNLLGRDVPARVTFPVSPNGVTQTFNGTYLGSDYHIIDSEGKRWQPDRETNLIVRYDSYPDVENGIKANLAAGLRFDSFDEDTDGISFTSDSATAAAQSFDGTVVREGLHILDAWLYDNLSSQEGRDRARADLVAARSVLTLEKRRYEIAATTVNFHRQRAELNIEGFDKEKEAVLIRQGQSLADAKDELSRQFITTQDSLSGAIALRRNYTLFFTGQQKQDPIFKLLLNINA